MTDPEAVGFIGLGQLGGPMAARLTSWPGGVIVHDARAAAMTPLAEAGAVTAASVADVAASASLICVMVRDDDQVRDVVRAVAAARGGAVAHAGAAARGGAAADAGAPAGSRT